MMLKQKVKLFVLGLGLMAGIVVALQSYPVAADCGAVQTSIIDCPQTGATGDLKDSGIWGVLLLAINILAAGIGVAPVAGIVYASILYTSSGGDQERTKKAMTIITDI